MNRMNDIEVESGAAFGDTSDRHRLLGLAVTGFVATLAAMVATTLAAALAEAVGVDFKIPDGGEAIPLPGFAVMTGLFSLVGIIIAVALLRWTDRPPSDSCGRQCRSPPSRWSRPFSQGQTPRPSSPFSDCISSLRRS